MIKEDVYPSFSYEQLPSHLFNNFINTENEEQNYSKTVEISNIFFGKTPNKTMKNQINILLKQACGRGLAGGVYSGVSAAVSVIKNKVRYRGYFSGGLTRLDQAGVPVEVSTPFDLASLTKPLCTTLCTLHLVASENINWDDAALPLLETTLPQDKKNINIRDILTHSSGLPAYLPYFREFAAQSSRDNIYPILQKIVKEPLQYSRGTTCLYSDLGFILLGFLLEKSAQIRLDQLYRKKITEPLNLAEKIFFMPSNSSVQTEKTEIAATEDCPWRKRIMQGEVHDEHCWLMGGVAGHAGLFGTAGGVLSLCECLLDCWQERASHPAFSNNLLRYALNWKQPGENCRRLGFDTPSSGQSSSGRYFSPKSVGHLGFTGTSFWIDLERNVIVVLLTNRVHPSRDNIKIREFRPFFHDFLMEKICG